MGFDLWGTAWAILSGPFGLIVSFIFGMALGFGVSGYLKQWG